MLAITDCFSTFKFSAPLTIFQPRQASLHRALRFTWGKVCFLSYLSRMLWGQPADPRSRRWETLSSLAVILACVKPEKSAGMCSLHPWQAAQPKAGKKRSEVKRGTAGRPEGELGDWGWKGSTEEGWRKAGGRQHGSRPCWGGLPTGLPGPLAPVGAAAGPGEAAPPSPGAPGGAFHAARPPSPGSLSAPRQSRLPAPPAPLGGGGGGAPSSYRRWEQSKITVQSTGHLPQGGTHVPKAGYFVNAPPPPASL